MEKWDPCHVLCFKISAKGRLRASSSCLSVKSACIENSLTEKSLRASVTGKAEVVKLTVRISNLHPVDWWCGPARAGVCLILIRDSMAAPLAGVTRVGLCAL